MTPSETKRLALFEKLVEALEEGPAVTLMEHLPPIGWDQFATKADLAAMQAHIDARFTRVDARFTEVDARFTEIDARFTEIDARFTEVDARIDTGLAQTRNEMLKAINRQTFIWTSALVGALLAYFLAGPPGV